MKSIDWISKGVSSRRGNLDSGCRTLKANRLILRRKTEEYHFKRNINHTILNNQWFKKEVLSLLASWEKFVTKWWRDHPALC